MKGNVFLVVISILISVLMAYGFFAANRGEPFVLLLTVGSGICFAVALSGLLAIKIAGRTGNLNLKVVSLIFFVLFLISNLIFGVIGMRLAPYIVVHGILLLLYSTIIYGLAKSEQ